MTKRTCTIDGCSNVHRSRGYCSTHYNRLILGEAKRHPRETRTCVVCCTPVTRRRDNHHQPTCSVRCRTVVQWGEALAPTNAYVWRSDAVQRARKAGVRIVENFDRIDIFERDDWTCQACHVRCSEPDPYNLRAATVDHIVPLAAGGEHSRANAQTLCLSCNSAKQTGISPAA